jgi:hypothetical protein
MYADIGLSKLLSFVAREIMKFRFAETYWSLEMVTASLLFAKWGLSEGWRGEVVKMCNVLIKSHDWRSVVNEKERNGWEERE